MMTPFYAFATLARVIGGGGGDTPSFDPTFDDPTGLWLPSYSGSPWGGTASAGTSGTSGSLITEDNAPTTGSPQNGLTPATFNGTTQALKAGTAASSALVSAGAFTALVCGKASSLTTTATDFYDDPALATDNAGNWGLTIGTSGVRAGIYVGSSGQTTPISISAGQTFMAAMRWDGSDINCRVVKGGTSTDAAPVAKSSPTLGATFRVGQNYIKNKYYAGDLFVIATYQRALSDSELVEWKRYFEALLAISL